MVIRAELQKNKNQKNMIFFMFEISLLRRRSLIFIYFLKKFY